MIPDSTEVLPASVAWAIENPDAARRLLDKLDAQARLIDYMALLWPVVEPGRPFVRGWAIEAICEHLEAVTVGHIRRLLINVPPGFSKSLATCVFWPSWEWGPRNRPDLRYVFTSYVGKLSEGNNVKLRRLVASDVYQAHWGDRVKLMGDQNVKTFFETTKTGFALATSTSGIGMGKRGDRGVIDDPNNTKDVDSDASTNDTLQWYTEVHPTRINDERTYAEVVIMQRTGENDVSGHILANRFGHEHLCIPMEWRRGHPHIRYFDRPTIIGWTDPRTEDAELAFPERFSREGVEDLKARLRSWGGTFAEAGQLDQLPAPRGGGVVNRDWFEIVDTVPEGGTSVRRWDLASTAGGGDWTVGVLMRRIGPLYYVLDVVRLQGSPHTVDAEILKTAKADGPAVKVRLPRDPGQAGVSQAAQHAAMLVGFDVRSIPETGSKQRRFTPFASQAEAGNVKVLRATWNLPYLAELAALWTGKHDDQADASSGAFFELSTAHTETVAAGPEIIDAEPVSHMGRPPADDLYDW